MVEDRKSLGIAKAEHSWRQGKTLLCSQPCIATTIVNTELDQFAPADTCSVC